MVDIKNRADLLKRNVEETTISVKLTRLIILDLMLNQASINLTFNTDTEIICIILIIYGSYHRLRAMTVRTPETFLVKILDFPTHLNFMALIPYGFKRGSMEWVKLGSDIFV